MEHLLYFFKDLKKVGAIAPSSKFLAKDLIAKLRKKITGDECPPLNILEIGAGTGPLTKQIVKHLRPNDRLDIVEIHKKFFQIVKTTYRQENITAYHRDILKFEPEQQYDFIFSSLPYENMPEDVSRNIWKKKLNLCKSGGHISYFKYVKFRDFKNDFEEQMVSKYGKEKKLVLLNIPPAKVYTLQVDDNKNFPVIEQTNVA